MDEAIKAWQEAMGIHPLGRADVHSGLGKALMARQRYVEALAILRATLEFYPGGGGRRDTLYPLGGTYLATGEAAQAVAPLEGSLKEIRAERGPDPQANTTPSCEERRLLPLDFVSTRETAAPFLVAVTLE